MIYLALLRGINVGGKNKVEMARLKTCFEKIGMQDVKTYINSGNVIFRTDSHKQSELATLLENAIKREFGFGIKVLLRDAKNIINVTKLLPASWVNDSTMKCDAMFLWEEYDNKDVMHQITIKPGIDDVKYVPGALLWRVDRPMITRSGMMKLASSNLYKHMTIRNCNSLRKLATLMQATATE